MRIGVICEGPTDFVVMSSFFLKDLTGEFDGIEFSIIQPALDNTLPGGWSEVLHWLENNPPENRSALYRKGQSLFLIEDDAQKFDALIFQMDTDIIGEPGFEKFCQARGLAVSRPVSPAERADFIREVIIHLAGTDTIERTIGGGEIPIAIVEACETWVIAAGMDECVAEELNPEDTCNNFGKIFARYSNQPEKSTYNKINKSVKSRRRVCEKICERGTPKGRAVHYDLSLQHIKKALSQG